MYARKKNGVFDGTVRENVSDLNPGAPWTWVPYVEGAKPAYDKATQKLVKTVDDGETQVTVTWTAQAMSAAEQDDADQSVLRARGEDIALVLVELVEWALANTAMTANDFSPDVKTSYLNLKAIADRLRA